VHRTRAELGLDFCAGNRRLPTESRR